MKTNLTRIFAAASIGLLVVCASVTPVTAQNVFQGRFTLSEEVRWQNATLPAGDYTFTLASSAVPAQVIVHGPSQSAIILTSARNERKASDGKSYLLVEHRGGTQFIREMVLAPLGADLMYRAPEIPKSERELAQGPASTEKVLIASAK